MSKVQTEAEAQLGSLKQQMEQLRADVQGQLSERAEAEERRLKELKQRCMSAGEWGSLCGFEERVKEGVL